MSCSGNPITGNNDLEVITTGDLSMSGTGTTGGWKYDVTVGKFIANDTSTDASGTVTYDQH